MKKSRRHFVGGLIVAIALAVSLLAPAQPASAYMAQNPPCSTPYISVNWVGTTAIYYACRPWNSGGAYVEWVHSRCLTYQPGVCGGDGGKYWIAAGKYLTWAYTYPAKTGVGSWAQTYFAGIHWVDRGLWIWKQT